VSSKKPTSYGGVFCSGTHGLRHESRDKFLRPHQSYLQEHFILFDGRMLDTVNSMIYGIFQKNLFIWIITLLIRNTHFLVFLTFKDLIFSMSPFWKSKDSTIKDHT
jgi:hypothetical protein